jgi:uncharacterized protein
VIRAVIDTNVLVSAMISPVGNESLVLLAVNQDLLTPCFSSDILLEYSEVLARPKFGFPGDEVDALINLLHIKGELVAPQAVRRSSPDPSDDKFIACALAAAPELLITGNKRHFPESHYGYTQVVKAAKLIHIIALDL